MLEIATGIFITFCSVAGVVCLMARDEGRKALAITAEVPQLDQRDIQKHLHRYVIPPYFDRYCLLDNTDLLAEALLATSHNQELADEIQRRGLDKQLAEILELEAVFAKGAAA